jgi:DNA repair photolyase
MYPWVTHTHSHLGGRCSHECVYCYVDNPRMGRPEKYQGPIRLIEKEFTVKYNTGKTIFIEHCNDLFAKEVPNEFIDRIIHHCKEFPLNFYVFQSKNPRRLLDWAFPKGTILGTTIETNRDMPEIGKAPRPRERAEAMINISGRKFVTIEPVLDFDVDILAGWIAEIRPEFLNLGADSKGHGLPEPTVEKIMALVDKLHEYGIELREKHNLQRLKPK